MAKKNKKKKNFLDYFITIILILAIGTFLYAAYNLFMIFSEYKAGEKTYEKLSKCFSTIKKDLIAASF